MSTPRTSAFDPTKNPYSFNFHWRPTWSFISGVTNIETQTMTVTTNPEPVAAQTNQRPTFLLAALFRLALLAGPLTLAIALLAHNPFLCIITCVAVLAIWLTVDIGPFRASRVVPQPVKAAPTAMPKRGNLARAQGWAGLFCHAVVLVALLHSKLSI